MKITILGCGNMGEALAQRLSANNQLYLYDRHIEKAKMLEQEGFGRAAMDIKEALAHSEVLILAVKPQNLKEAAGLIGKTLKKEQILISLLAGVSIETLKRTFSSKTIVRMMPNLALIYGEGAIGLSSDENMLKKDKEDLNQILDSLGKLYWLPEDKINALTALAGSGPAFFLVMIEAMVDAGIAMGLPVIEAQDLTQQMLRGTLTLLEKSSKHPGELKWLIASPQGTTISGLKRLEELALRGGIMNTFLAAYDRANYLSKESGK